jgi:uncharacterized membrane protein YbhN (UPF0104 family)
MAAALEGEVADSPGSMPHVIRSMRLFATEPRAPRARRPTDAVLVGFGLVTLLAASWAADPPGALSDDITRLAEDSPEWVNSIWQVFFDFLPLWAGILIVLSIVRRHFVLAVSMVATVIVGCFVSYASHRFALVEALDFEEFIREFTRSESPAGFPAVRLVAATAVLVAASPAVTRPFRFFGRIVLGLGFLAGLGLGAATVAGSIGGLAVGVVAAGFVHLVTGSPGGRPTSTTVTATLAELGVPVRDVEPALVEPAGVVLMNATDVHGRALAVKVYGRDAWDSQLITKLWRWTWYRDGRTPLLLSRLHQVEHEALLTVLAGQAGTPVPDIVVAGAAADGNAALVSTVAGTPLEQTADNNIDDANSLVELWSAMQLAHDRGLVHGAIDRQSVTLDHHGSPLLIDWSAASVAAPQAAIDNERAQLLVLTALVAGADRAVSIARDSIGSDRLVDVLPYLQTPALTTGLRRDLKDLDLDLDDLRTLTAEASDVDEVELVKLRRVTVKSILSMALVAIVATMLISSLAEIGLDTIIDELSTATWGWVIAALIVAQSARIFTAASTTGATNQPLRFGPTVILEFAITFVNLAMPGPTARVATKMRYFQKAGMTPTSAVAMSAVDSIASFLVQSVIVVSAFLFGAGGTDFDFDVDTDSVKNLLSLIVIIVVVLILIAVAIVLFVQSARQRVTPILRQVQEAFRVIRSPERLLRLFGGNVLAEITFAAVVGLSLLAYGESAPIASLLVVNVCVGLLAWVVPVPGGIGVSEAALTAGLIAIGIPEATAFAAAITTRLCTFYLPPIWGYFAMRWLRTNQYL